MKTDKEIVDWLCDRAMVLGWIDKDGVNHYEKIEGRDTCFRDILIAIMEEDQ